MIVIKIKKKLKYSYLHFVDITHIQQKYLLLLLLVGVGEDYANTPSLNMYLAEVEVKADELRCPLVYFIVSFLSTQLVSFMC